MSDITMATTPATTSPMWDYRFGICRFTQEDVRGVREPLRLSEVQLVADYRGLYRATFGRDPVGLHYIPGLTDDAPVWLPTTE